MMRQTSSLFFFLFLCAVAALPAFPLLLHSSSESSTCTQNTQTVYSYSADTTVSHNNIIMKLPRGGGGGGGVLALASFLLLLTTMAAASASSTSAVIMDQSWSSSSSSSSSKNPPTTKKEKGMNVIIVGGSSGMGKATAFEVLRHGGQVMLVSRNETKLQQAKQELLQQCCDECGDDTTGGGIVVPSKYISTYTLDITNENDVQVFAETLQQQQELSDDDDDNNSCCSYWNGLVITAASRASHGPVIIQPTNEIQQLFNSKVWGAYYCAKYIGPKLLYGGCIVFCAGILNRRPGVNCASLAMANGALEAFTKSLALEFGGSSSRSSSSSSSSDGSSSHKKILLRVNCLSPGFCNTERFDHMESTRKQQMLEHTASSLPLQKVGQPSDMGQAIYYLLTAPFCTGVILDVDGGHGIRQYANPSTDPMRRRKEEKNK